MTSRTPYTALIQQVANTYGLPADLLEGQVVVESGGDPWAFRYEAAFFEHYIKDNPHAKAQTYGPLAACSYGLLQILLEVAYEQGYTDRPEGLFVPRVGLAFGAKALRALLDWAHGDMERALCAYNGGKGAALVPPYATQAYADQVYRAAGRTS